VSATFQFNWCSVLRHSRKLYPVSGITFLHMNRTKLFGQSKCFLANRDNFFPYEQALRACSYWQKLSRLARKLFDKFTSEISPWYENNMKSYTAFIWDKKFSRLQFSRWQVFSHMNTTFPLSGITFCRVSNFSIQLMFSHSRKLYPVSGIKFLHMNRTKVFG
jgi:hypothetical protein